MSWNSGLRSSLVPILRRHPKARKLQNGSHEDSDSSSPVSVGIETGTGTWNLHPSCPGSNRGITATVRVQYCQRIRSSRLAVNRHEHAAPAGEHVKDAAIVCLEADAPHQIGRASCRERV